MEEFVEITPADFQCPLELDWSRQHLPELDKMLIVDVGDIFDEMELGIRSLGESPIHDRYDQHTQMFLEEIYNAVCFLPYGSNCAIANIENVLQTCGMYFQPNHISPVQRQAWYFFTERLVDRFKSFRLYNHRFENQYDYYCLRGDALYLKLFE